MKADFSALSPPNAAARSTKTAAKTAATCVCAAAPCACAVRQRACREVTSFGECSSFMESAEKTGQESFDSF